MNTATHPMGMFECLRYLGLAADQLLPTRRLARLPRSLERHSGGDGGGVKDTAGDALVIDQSVDLCCL